MRHGDYEKQLLRQRIDAQRKVAGMELRSATDGLSRIHQVTRVAREILPVLKPVRVAYNALGPSQRRLVLVALAAAALAPMIRSLFRR